MLLFWLIWGTFAAAQSDRLSLADAVRAAVEQSPEVGHAAEELALAALEEPRLLAETDPVLGARAAYSDDRAPRASPALQGSYARAHSLNLSYGQKWLTGTEAKLFFNTMNLDNPAAFRPLNPTVDARLGFEARQPFLRNFWGRPDIAKKRQARAGVRAAELRLGRATEEAAARAAFAYVEAAVARESVRVREAALEDARRLRGKYLEKKRYGLVEESDLLQAEASVRLQEAELRLARAQRTQAENALRWALHRPEDAPIEELSLPPPPRRALPAVGEAARTALAGRADLKALRSEAERVEWFLRVESLSTLPELAAFGSYAGAGLNSRTALAWKEATRFDAPVATAGLELQVAWGRKRESTRREEARRRLNAARLSAQRLEEAVRRETADALERLAASIDRAAILKDLMDFERRKLKSAEEDFRRGRSSTDLLIRFQGDIHRARTILLRAEADVLAGWAELSYASGRLLEAVQELGSGQ